MESASHGADRTAVSGRPADRRLVVNDEADPVFIEQYRRLGAALHHVQTRDGIRTVMVASAIAGEGKTLSATNLALTLSRSFKRRVLLVDGDLRKPAVHHLLALENSSGFSDILSRPRSVAPRSLSPTLAVMTAGRRVQDPVPLLTSDATGEFLADMRGHFDWIVVDTPPVVLFPDAGLLAQRLDATVMVVGAGIATPAASRTAVAALHGSRLLGVVLNRADSTEIAGGYNYGPYGYASHPSSPFAWRRSRRSR